MWSRSHGKQKSGAMHKMLRKSEFNHSLDGIYDLTLEEFLKPEEDAEALL